MKRCKSCILPDTFPGISFNNDGICTVCQKFSAQKNYDLLLEKIKKRMHQIIDENRSKNPKYDVLVAFSGGKDSTYLIHKLRKEYGLNVLAFTFDNGFLSEGTFSNIKNVLENLEVDHIIFKPNFILLNKIFYISANKEIYPLSLLKFGSSICISCIRMVSNFSLKTAIEKSIPMVMLGNSPGQLIQSENEILYRDNRIPYELKKNLFKPLADIIGDEVYFYLTLNKEEYKTKPFPYTINPFPLIGYDEGIIYNTIEALGWKRPDDVDPNSSNCKLNSLGIIKHIEKYNFHPYDYEMSMLIRQGKIDRNEALLRVEDPENKATKFAKNIEHKLNSYRYY